jgi:hypothetical protein
MNLRILPADDHTMVRQGLREVIEECGRGVINQTPP